MNREQIVRDTAYAIWEAEGKPDGRAEDHWRQAETRVSASLTGGKTKAATGSAKSKTAAAIATRNRFLFIPALLRPYSNC